MSIDRIGLRTKIQNKLPSKRLEHTLGVEYTAAALAMCYGVDIEQAAAAGLLHDCAKHLSNEKKIAKCKEVNIPITKYEHHNPELLHSKLGAYYAKTKYGVTDQVVLDAIICHTTGRPDMSTLDKILYVADYIEPNRDKAPKLALVRYLAFNDLDECLLVILENTLEFLQISGSEIDDITTQTYDYYVAQRKNKK